ncbi:MAG: hypothetical protein MJZ61_03760 [Bacteroidales bacterium]|nr:hypothetical protein [Bacteroidales bacterium]
MENKKLYKLEKIAIAYHPGEMLDEKLSEMEISPKEFAKMIGKDTNFVESLIAGNISVTPDIANDLEKATLIPAHMWIKEQRSFDK